MRPPLFDHEFETVLLPFQYHKPALAPLFQFPPTSKSDGQCTQYPKIFLLSYMSRGETPLTSPPLQRLIAKATAEVRPRVRNSEVTIPRPQASLSTERPRPTDQQNNSAVSIPGIVAIISALRAA